MKKLTDFIKKNFEIDEYLVIKIGLIGLFIGIFGYLFALLVHLSIGRYIGIFGVSFGASSIIIDPIVTRIIKKRQKDIK